MLVSVHNYVNSIAEYGVPVSVTGTRSGDKVDVVHGPVLED